MARSFGLLSVDNNVATTAYDREVCMWSILM
jgi:hypothetical protein